MISFQRKICANYFKLIGLQKYKQIFLRIVYVQDLSNAKNLISVKLVDVSTGTLCFIF